MYYLIITFFLYAHSLVSSQDVNLPSLTFSEINDNFFKEIKKSKYKNIGLSLGSGLLYLGFTQLLSKKYPITKKQALKFSLPFFILPLAAQAAAYTYFGKKSQLRNNFLFSQIYLEVLKKRQDKSETRLCLCQNLVLLLPHKEPNKKPNKKIEDENAEEFVELINKLTKENLETNDKPIPEIINMLISVLEKETVFKEYVQLLKKKLTCYRKTIIIVLLKSLLSRQLRIETYRNCSFFTARMNQNIRKKKQNTIKNMRELSDTSYSCPRLPMKE